MRGRFAILFILLLGFPFQFAEAQELSTDVMQPQVGLDAHLEEDRWHTARSLAEVNAVEDEQGASGVALTLGSAGGWLLGAAAGGTAGYNSGTGFDALGYAILGSAIGGAIGSPLGAHFANNRRGNPLVGVLANTAVIAAVAFGVSGPGIIAILPPAQITVGAFIEHRTSR